MRWVQAHCHEIVCEARNGILTTTRRARWWMGEAMVEEYPQGVPGARVGSGADRCDLVLHAIMQPTADGSNEQIHEARADLEAKDAEVPAALSLRIISAG